MTGKTLSHAQVGRLKHRLEVLVARLAGEASAAQQEIVGEDAQLFRDLTPSGDGALAESELERDVANAGRTKDAVARARAALARIESGRYGVCDACELNIGIERLEVEPTAIRCLACQRQVERTPVLR